MDERVKVSLLRLADVIAVVGIKRSEIYERIKTGKFPAPVRLGAKAVAWRSDEIQEWIDSRPRVTAGGGQEG